MAMTQPQDSDEWEELTFETTPVLEHMREQGMTLTRQSYLEFCYPDGVPDPLHPELAAEVPRWLRDDELLH